MAKKNTVLAAVRAKRGYVLTYHRLLNEVSPDLLAAYDDFYTKFTLTSRVLTPVEKETIWMALIAATRAKPSGRIHLPRARKAGMGPQAIADTFALAGACEGIDLFGFSADAFGEWFTARQAKAAYLRSFEAARGRIPKALAHTAAAVAQAGRRNAAGMALHLVEAFRAGAKREQVAEGLCYVLMHCGGPTMLDAMDCWIGTAARHRIPKPCPVSPA